MAIRLPPRVPNSPGFTPAQSQQIAAPAGAFGSGGEGLVQAGNAIMQAGKAGFDIAQKEEEQRQQDLVRGADVILSDWGRQQQSQFIETRGANTDAAWQGYQQAWRDKVAEIRQTLPSDQAIRTFDAMAQSRMDSAFARGDAHRLQQKEWLSDQTFAARQSSLTQDALADWSNNDAFDKAMQAKRSDLLDRATRKGWDAQIFDAAWQKEQAAVYGQRIAAAMSADPVQGRALYEQYASLLDVQTRAQLDQVTRKAATEAAGMRAADMAYAGLTQPRFDGGVGATIAVEGTIKNTRSSAVGVGQFVNATWLDMIRTHRPWLAEGKTDAEILALRQDNGLAAEMVDAYRQDNARSLQQAGLPVTDGTLYLAHFLGAGDAQRVLSAGMDTPIEQVVQDRSRADNPEVFSKVRTAGDMVAWADKKMGKAAPLEQAWQQVAAIQDPETRRVAESRLTAMLNQQKAVEKAREEDAQAQMYAVVQSGGRVDDVPPQIRVAAGIEAETKARAFEKSRLQPRETPADLYFTLWKQMTSAPQDFVGENLYQYRSQMADDDWKYFRGQQDQLREGANKERAAQAKEAAKERAKLPDYGLVEKIISQMLPIVGWSASGAKAKNRPEDVMTLHRLGRQVADQAGAEGRVVTADEIMRGLAPALLDLKGDEYGTGAFARTGTVAAMYGATIDNPEDQLSLISQALGANPEIVAKTIENLQSQSGLFTSGPPITLDAIAKAMPGVVAKETGRPEDAVRAVLEKASRLPGGAPGMTITDIQQGIVINAPQSRPWGE